MQHHVRIQLQNGLDIIRCHDSRGRLARYLASVPAHFIPTVGVEADKFQAGVIKDGSKAGFAHTAGRPLHDFNTHHLPFSQ
jgi:hypothetical protein